MSDGEPGDDPRAARPDPDSSDPAPIRLLDLDGSPILIARFL